MATRIMQLELLEDDMFIELEAEETLKLNVVIGKLKAMGHLASDKDYYIKNTDGSILSDGNLLKTCKEDKLVLTTEKDWKPQLTFSGGFSNVEEVSGKIVLNGDTYWMLPFLDEALWNDFDGWANLFLLENILLSDGNTVDIRVLTQCSVLNIETVNAASNTERANKMLRVLENVINYQLAGERLSVNNIHERIDDLSEKMRHYLNTYTEFTWGAGTNTVQIIGIDINV